MTVHAAFCSAGWAMTALAAWLADRADRAVKAKGVAPMRNRR